MSSFYRVIPHRDYPGGFLSLWGHHEIAEICDPFLAQFGQYFWMLLYPNQVTTVTHSWKHDYLDFTPPDAPPRENQYLAEAASALGVTYENLLVACERAATEDGELMEYTGKVVDLDTFFDEEFELYVIFDEWSELSGHEFPNDGTECCPEYDYPTELYKT